MLKRLLRLFGFKHASRTIANLRWGLGYETRQPLTDQEAEEIKERHRLDNASIYAT